MRAPDAQVGAGPGPGEPGAGPAPAGDRAEGPARATQGGRPGEPGRGPTAAAVGGGLRGPGRQVALSAGVACLASALTAGGVALSLGRERRAFARDVEERARAGAAEVLAPEAVRRGGEAAARGAVEGLARGVLDVALEGARDLNDTLGRGEAGGRQGDRTGAAPARGGPRAGGAAASRGGGVEAREPGARGGLGRALDAGLELAEGVVGVAAEEGPEVARSTTALAAGAFDALLGGLAPAPRAGPGGAEAADGEGLGRGEGRVDDDAPVGRTDGPRGTAAVDLLDLLGAPRGDRARR